MTDASEDPVARLVLELQHVRDRQAIHDVVMLYCRGVDRCDEAIVRSAYHADAFDDHGYWRGNGHDFARFVTRAPVAGQHLHDAPGDQLLIDVDGEDAVAESQVVATLVRRGSPIHLSSPMSWLRATTTGSRAATVRGGLRGAWSSSTGTRPRLGAPR